MNTDTDRIRRLERALWLVGATLAIAIAVAVLALIKATASTQASPPTEFSIDGLTISKWGTDVKNPVDSKRQSEAKLQATSSAAYLSLGVGKLDMTFAADAKSNTLRFEALGKVESRIEVDTDTGAWTLVRTLHDAKYNVTKEDRLPLAGALQP